MSVENFRYPVKELYHTKYRIQQDILAIASIGHSQLDPQTAEYYKKVIKGKMQELWMDIGIILEELGAAEACGCSEHSHCEKCIGKRYLDVD